MNLNQIDFSRLSYLGDKVKHGLATEPEKDEFMLSPRVERGTEGDIGTRE